MDPIFHPTENIAEYQLSWETSSCVMGFQLYVREHWRFGYFSNLNNSWVILKQFLGNPLHRGRSQAQHFVLVRTPMIPSLVLRPTYLHNTQYFCFPFKLSTQCKSNSFICKTIASIFLNELNGRIVNVERSTPSGIFWSVRNRLDSLSIYTYGNPSASLSMKFVTCCGNNTLGLESTVLYTCFASYRRSAGIPCPGNRQENVTITAISRAWYSLFTAVLKKKQIQSLSRKNTSQLSVPSSKRHNYFSQLKQILLIMAHMLKISWYPGDETSYWQLPTPIPVIYIVSEGTCSQDLQSTLVDS